MTGAVRGAVLLVVLATCLYVSTDAESAGFSNAAVRDPHVTVHSDDCISFPAITDSIRPLVRSTTLKILLTHHAMCQHERCASLPLHANANATVPELGSFHLRPSPSGFVCCEHYRTLAGGLRGAPQPVPQRRCELPEWRNSGKVGECRTAAMSLCFEDAACEKERVWCGMSSRATQQCAGDVSKLIHGWCVSQEAPKHSKGRTRAILR